MFTRFQPQYWTLPVGCGLAMLLGNPVAAQTVSRPLAVRVAHKPVRGCAANQVAIPGGTFSMGEDRQKARPVHKVTLSPYCIDKIEVTVAAFRACVQAGGCPPGSATIDYMDIKPENKTRWSQFCTWGKSDVDQHPINCVDWNQASAYCTWTGNRLPTEAEWEFAARGIDGRIYPWGNDRPDQTRLNACGAECVSMAKERLGEDWSRMYPGNDGWAVTAPVGQYPKGASPFGVLDMAGNVAEWTADSVKEYDAEPSTNPNTLRLDEWPRVYRGGSWFTGGGFWDDSPSRVTSRASDVPGRRSSDIGFRCVRGARP
jgi:formylglycine-generating enzyme required for sulfatase activity